MATAAKHTQIRVSRFHQMVGSGLLMLFVIGLSGCATIVSEKRYPVTIANAQAPTYFSIQNRKNETIHQGVTPQQLTLDAKAFPFWPAKYNVVFAGNDATTQTVPLKAKLDPWVAGNIILGGVAGTVVDGATGAMFKLHPATVCGDGCESGILLGLRCSEGTSPVQESIANPVSNPHIHRRRYGRRADHPAKRAHGIYQSG